MIKSSQHRQTSEGTNAGRPPSRELWGRRHESGTYVKFTQRRRAVGVITVFSLSQAEPFPRREAASHVSGQAHVTTE